MAILEFLSKNPHWIVEDNKSGTHSPLSIILSNKPGIIKFYPSDNDFSIKLRDTLAGLTHDFPFPLEGENDIHVTDLKKDSLVGDIRYDKPEEQLVLGMTVKITLVDTTHIDLYLEHTFNGIKKSKSFRLKAILRKTTNNHNQ